MLICDEEKPYRPELLRTHSEFASFFEAAANTVETAVAVAPAPTA